ncbi:MAG TPA: exodeoxyribonuclease VII large subunit [Chthoniobacterales bacterium]|nr:exodeoxyribonuclease VII large subunit [Chthoniobacterales bacterium]
MATIFSVTEFTRRVRDLLEGHLRDVWIEGEISNYRKQSSGHHYFTLKDDRAQVACVMFSRAYSAQAGTILRDGVQVQAFGRVSVYEARGQYQLIVELVQTKGLGLLQAKFEALKRKLEAEGRFDPAHKKALPPFPRRVALVTSPTGAAVKDMLNILQRRSPWLRLLICPVRVQGEGAAEEIASTINYLSENQAAMRIDVLIVGRGGGSLEDLWAFNEEVLARAIFACRIPTISAVGHEIDFTIADFVADLRAPTPSAAAELVAPAIDALFDQINSRRLHLERVVKQHLEIRRLKLNRIEGAAIFREPSRLISERQQWVDQLEIRLTQVRDWMLQQRRDSLLRLTSLVMMFKPAEVLERRRKEIGLCREKLCSTVRQRLEREQLHLKRLTGAVRLLGPEQTLRRGYSITEDENGKVIHSANAVAVNQKIKTILADGSIWSRTE